MVKDFQSSDSNDFANQLLNSVTNLYDFKAHSDFKFSPWSHINANSPLKDTSNDLSKVYNQSIRGLKDKINW